MSVVQNNLLMTPEGYTISNSVRLRSSASAYFNRTPAGAGNRKTWTWSGWHKRGKIASDANLFAAFITNTNQTDLSFSASDDKLYFTDYQTTAKITCSTNAVFRDPSAWYHILISVDTTQATNSNGVKLYVNGVQQTLTFTAYTQNQDTMINSTNTHQIGARYSSSPYYQDGYLTDVNFIDGQALTPSSFGETDSITGVWKPKKYAGTYGTNGFYLNFSDNSAATAAAIGKDSSGNGNNWTPNNISVTAGVTYDSMLDVPTPYADGGNGRGNYCVMNPLVQRWSQPNVAFSEGNLKATVSSAVNSYCNGTIFPTSGKWYWETTVVSAGGAIGVSDNQLQNTTFTNSVFYNTNGTKDVANVNTAYGSTYTTNDVIGVALDCDGGTVTFYKNNVSQGAITLPSGSVGLSAALYLNNTVHAINFGQRPFTYTPPTGFKALNTQNLPDATIKKGNQYFDVSTWAGNSSTQNIVNTAGFQPDLVWIKDRSAARSHRLFDAVRGATKGLFSDATDAETTLATDLTAFNSNGFALGAGAGSNATSETYVGWQWKESAAAGFDIVTFTNPASGSASFAHSLGVKPSMIITKARSGTGNWTVTHKSLGANMQDYYLLLNGTAASTTSAGIWGGEPTSSVFYSSASLQVPSATMVAYLFSEVAGFSRFGSFTGNGSTDGPFVYCGFRPKFVMVKRTDSTGGWVMFDTSRESYNVMGAELAANNSAAEASPFSQKDFLSNGFKIRNTQTDHNASGGTYIYAAFAENPFKNSLAR